MRMPARFRWTTALMLSLALLLAASSAFAADEEEDADERLEAAAKALAVQMKSKDLDTRAEAAEAACQNSHESLTTPLIKLLRDESAAVRLPALVALAARTDKAGRRRAADAIADRVPRLEKDPGGKDETLAALDALQTLAQPGPIKGLISSIKVDSDDDIVRAKLMAIAHVPDEEAIDRLIQFLGKGRRGQQKKQRESAAAALQFATGQRFGHDPDKWRAWWRDAKDTFDFEAMAAARAEASAEAAAKAEKRRAQKEEREKKKSEREKQKADEDKGPGKPGSGKKKTDESDA